MNFTIAAQMFTLRDYMTTPENMRETFKRVRNMGYTAIQMSGMGDVDEVKAKYIKELAEEFELTICVTHVGLNLLKENLDWAIEFHKMWNCEYVGLGALPEECRRSKETYIEFATMMNDIGKKLSEAGLKLVYHNHDFEFIKYDGKTGMDILFESFDPRYVEFELDTYWVQQGGCSPQDWIRKVDGRMGVVHFKDMGILSNREHYFAEIGSGNLDWDKIIAACDETQVKWAAIERDRGEKDPFESLEESIKFLKSKGL
ncbi:sugar phosphate isomerase/epimerase family protein [Clostridium grantii]|uniref:Sugar phosphate isomerase/epimerase n=1 Tax=Clostridium grantii DSM 8605 TaxID=1121316 RepID=A0A1M5SUU4_9CLOT|nr:TIM barrel protein [Clostridium grantii]SHH42295.1 Sugar phosphate isomerase/epimerase [Clostridium grantii DSM 8605]